MVFCNLRKQLIGRRQLPKTVVHNQGFTLLELLVALLVSGFIFSGLLSMIVSFLNVDRRESRLDQLQQDVQRASDFITDDLREAIYVYNDVYDDAAFLALIRQYINAASTPVLVFWRPVPIEGSELDYIEFPTDPTKNCVTEYTGGDIQECELLRARRSTYSLVIYAHRDNDPATENWRGPARLERYELPKYVDLEDSANPFAISDGYEDLTDTNLAGFNDFENWVPVPPLTRLTPTVLVDKVGFNYSTAAASGAIVNCDIVTGSTPPGPYSLLPADATEDSAFYACVRDTTPSATVNPDNEGVRAAQDVYLVVQGDARSGITAADRGDTRAKATNDLPLNGANELSRFPAIESLTLVGGGINRDG